MYTLLKFLGWGILLAVVGGCVGWALRSLKARGDLSSARGTAADAGEVEHLRQRLADHEAVVAERDRLRMQIADLRHTDSPGVVGATADDGEPAVTSTGVGLSGDPDDQQTNADDQGDGDGDR